MHFDFSSGFRDDDDDDDEEEEKNEEGYDDEGEPDNGLGDI